MSSSNQGSGEGRNPRRAFLQTLFAGAATAGVQAGCYDPSSALPPATTMPQRLGNVGRAPDGMILVASADAVLRADAQHTNEGANPWLRVGVRPVSRAVVQFDPEQVARLLAMNPARVSLVLTIACNHNEWGQTDRRTVDVHPIRTPFTEGNGRQTGLSGADQRRAMGGGCTWTHPTDSNTADDAPDRAAATAWNGAMQGPASASAVHTNRLTGDVVWDVTADVRAGIRAWMVKVTDEETPSTPERTVVGGDNGYFGGTVEYHARENATEDATRAPRLVFSAATLPAPSASPMPTPAPSMPAPSTSPMIMPSMPPPSGSRPPLTSLPMATPPASMPATTRLPKASMQPPDVTLPPASMAP